jgi:hypothetical protein
MAESSSDPTVVPIGAAIAGEVKEGLAVDGDQAYPTPEQGAPTQISAEPHPFLKASPGLVLKVQDVRVGNPDGRGLVITQIYASWPGQYAIYRAGQVMVHFSDNPNLALAQRSAIAPLGPARAELNFLLGGLPRRGVFDHKLAYCLLLALNGDLEGAKTGLSAAIGDVLTQREAAGRVQYLTWSYVAAAVMLGLLFVGSWAYRFDQPSSNLWLAGTAGLVGAAFSIALAVRGRAAVALDIDRATNLMDGTLRLLIGAVSAGVLLMLLASGILPVIKIGDATFSGTGLTWQTVLVIGFVAGFLERLVPDLLEKKNTQGKGS